MSSYVFCVLQLKFWEKVTFPSSPQINGKFTDPQKIIYEIVLDVQQSLIDDLKRNSNYLSMDLLYSTMQNRLKKLLMKEGIVKDSNENSDVPKNEKLSLQQTNLFMNDFCPHHVSHFLGMDVHDTALISR